jgi:hypothetical protein
MISTSSNLIQANIGSSTSYTGEFMHNNIIFQVIAVNYYDASNTLLLTIVGVSGNSGYTYSGILSI